jgi:hypothetical protein
MTDVAPTGHLSGEEVLALRFAAHRQLARWAKKPRLSPDQHARRNALKRAVAALHDPDARRLAQARPRALRIRRRPMAHRQPLEARQRVAPPLAGRRTPRQRIGLVDARRRPRHPAGRLRLHQDTPTRLARPTTPRGARHGCRSTPNGRGGRANVPESPPKRASLLKVAPPQFRVGRRPELPARQQAADDRDQWRLLRAVCEPRGSARPLGPTADSATTFTSTWPSGPSGGRTATWPGSSPASVAVAAGNRANLRSHRVGRSGSTQVEAV